MATTVYVLSAVASLVAAGLLLRGYVRSRARLLFWSSVCFLWLAANNVLLVVDLVVVTDIDFAVWRAITGLVGPAVLLYGLIWETR